MLHRSSQEHQRLALETNLRGNMPDLSLNFEESVEYPRHMDSHPQSIQSWFHNDEEDEGIHPFAGETLSTAAHHASVLTLSAGLRGHHRRADTSYATSLSGAEYDPERSLFAMDPVFDKSNELDRLLQSGHQQRSVRIRSPLHSIASSSDTESHRSVPAASSRPKLSDTLRNNTTFSPKRPKNPSKSSPALATRVPEDDNPTPRPRRQHSAPAATFSGPEFRVQPPTPSIKASKPTRESSYSNQQKLPTPSPLRRGVLKSNSSRRVYLPDVTGLTSAVESPAKGNLRHAMYTNGRSRDSEARLLTIVSAIQMQLTEMEQANGVSRRRVRELESELEDCKREVRRERARVDDLGLEAERLRKGKARAHDDEADVTIRYREVVEEKKALENLLTTLRSHLTRLTKELQSHQKFLKELRELRESDARSLEERGSEIQQLRDEVGRLKGEVDVLREVVEDGLRERRQKVRDHDTAQEDSVANTAMSVEESDHESELEPLEPRSIPGSSRPSHTHDEEEIPSTFVHPRRADRTMRTDYATLGTQSSRPATSTPLFDQNAVESFVDDDELERIEREVAERRSRNESRLVSESEGEAEDLREPPSVLAAAKRQERRDHQHQRVRVERTHVNMSMHPPRPTAPTPKHAAAHRPTTPPPFPQIRGEHMERLFFSAPPHDSVTCKVCHRQRVATSGDGDATSDGDDIKEQVRTKVPSRRDKEMRKAARDALPSPLLDDDDEEANNDDGQWDTKWRREARKLGVPPQTVVARVIRELEDDFTHYKSIYVELADTYKVLDAASNVPKRNLVAKHLKEVVDILEAKGDQIAALYNLLAFKS